MHEGASQHFLLAGREIRTGCTRSMACSLPSDFYRWGHRKATVYATEVSDVDNLQQRIQNGTEMFVRDLEFSCQSDNHCSDVQLTV